MHDGETTRTATTTTMWLQSWARRTRSALARASRLAAIVGAALLVSLIACERRGVPPRGVVIVVMDTTRADRCSFLGYDRPTTPRLAALARESAVFTNAWSPAPWTLPAHASLFTGLAPDRHRAGFGTSMHLVADVPTLAGLLAGDGWATACFSANPFVSKEFGVTRGFGTERVFRGGRQTSPDAVVPPAASQEVCAEAIRWIRAQRAAGGRYFACLNLMEPHAPYAPPEAAAARFRRGHRDDPDAAEDRIRSLSQRDLIRASFLPGLLTAPMCERLSDLYDADLSTLDDEIGRFVEMLRADGSLDDTLLVVVADHGEGLGDHGWIEHATILNQELLHVPLLVRLPRRFAPRRESSVVCLEDVFATVLDVCGMKTPRDLDGLTLAAPRAGRIALACESAHEEWIPRIAAAAPGADLAKLRTWRRSATDGEFHLIVEGTGRTELFDLRNDPLEQRDVSGAHPEVERRLLDALAARPAPFR